MTVKSKGKGSQLLALEIESGDVTMPPPEVQRNAALNLAAQADSPEALREVLLITGIIEPPKDPNLCARGHRLNDKGLCVKCDSKKSRVTHCRNGHEYLPETTKFEPSGRRKCLICYETQLEKQRKRRQKQPCLRCGGPKGSGDRHLCSSCKAKRDGFERA